MPSSLLADGLRHHTWATDRLLGVCAALTAEQLASGVPGTYGSILDTLRHVVESDSWYLSRCSGGATQPMDDADDADLDQLRAAAERTASGWEVLLQTELDPDRMIETRRDDGSETHAPLGIRLAQVLHHGTDHRSQVCTALTALGIEPPDISVWAYGEAVGRTREVPPNS